VKRHSLNLNNALHKRLSEEHEKLHATDGLGFNKRITLFLEDYFLLMDLRKEFNK